MQCLVVGFGSIGRRHAQVLTDLGCKVVLVSSQSITDFACYKNINEALTRHPIDYTVIANPTYLHHQTLIELIHCDYRGVVLIEKPLFINTEVLPPHHFSQILVAYNLRFCELLQTTKSLLSDDKIISFSAYVGQYLPNWRKNIDYKDSYSAKQNQGGGVLRDLSHELDYSQWFCGDVQDVTALGGQFSELEIDSEDIYSIIMRCTHCPVVTIQLNYLDRAPRRDILIHTNRHTFSIDLAQGSVSVDGEIKFQNSHAVAETYYRQHAAALAGKFELFCNYREGLTTVKLIEKITEANTKKQWITA